MLFSIIVPIYNVEAYIRKCLDSLTGQTFGDIEIILVDDGSPDGCPAICDEYAKKDNRIKVVHKKNGGLSDARNAGMDVATGKYVIFVDSDDYVERDMCEKFAALAANDHDVMIGEAVVEGGASDLRHIESSDTSVYTGVEYLKLAHKANRAPMAVWLNVYKREFLMENGLAFRYGILHEDEQFTPRVLLAASSVVCTGIVFYHYIIREGSITTKKDKRKNAVDLYGTCCELESIYRGLPDVELQRMLLDSLVRKYLNIFQVAELCRYGREYLHGDFLKRNAYNKKTRLKVALMVFSPKLYYKINSLAKTIS